MINEINTITSESSPVEGNTFNLSENSPRILLKCIAENYVSSVNNIEIIVDFGPGTTIKEPPQEENKNNHNHRHHHQKQNLRSRDNIHLK